MSLLSDPCGWDPYHTQSLHLLEHPVEDAMFREMVRATLYNEMLQCTAMHNVSRLMIQYTELPVPHSFLSSCTMDLVHII
jgi:hypothetical protein